MASDFSCIQHARYQRKAQEKIARHARPLIPNDRRASADRHAIVLPRG